MSVERYWEVPLRSIAKFSERLLNLEPLNHFSWRVRRVLSNAFWGYHFLVLTLIFLEGSLNVVEGVAVKAAAVPLMVLWGIYAFHFIIVYLPSNGLYELYSYLRKKELPPSHAIVISVLSVIGVVSLLLLARYT